MSLWRALPSTPPANGNAAARATSTGLRYTLTIASANAIIGKARGRLVSGTGVITIQETVR